MLPLKRSLLPFRCPFANEPVGAYPKTLDRRVRVRWEGRARTRSQPPGWHEGPREGFWDRLLVALHYWLSRPGVGWESLREARVRDLQAGC